MGESSRHITLLLNTITYYNHLVEQLTVLFEGYIDLTLTSYGNSLVAETYVAEYEACILRNIVQAVLTVKVGNRTCRSSLYHDAGTDD